MSNRFARRRVGVLCAWLLAPVLFAQPSDKPPDAKGKNTVPKDPAIYFYNQRMDALAQSAEKSAGDVLSGQSFDAALENLKTLTKPSIDRIFTSAHRAAVAQLQDGTTWERIGFWVDRAQKNAAKGVNEEKWKKGSDALDAEIEKARTASTTTRTALATAADLLNEVGNADQVIDFAQFLKDKKVADVTPADMRVIGQIQNSVANVAQILSGLQKQTKPPSARSAVDRMQIDLARAELDYLKAVAGIEQRRVEGEKDVKGLISSITGALDLLKQAGIRGDEEVTVTLKRLAADPAQKENLGIATLMLQNWAAFTARGDTPARLAAMRGAIEERAYRIRRDAIMARSYEEILVSGTSRIAAYYKGGVKPETIAQFIQALSTAGLIPAISLR